MLRYSQIAYYLLFAVLFTSCATQSGVGLLGTYVEVNDKRLVTLEREEYSFLEDGRFRYIYRSDDVSSSKIGFGDFNIEEEKLMLQFKQTDDLEQSTVLERPVAGTADDRYEYHFAVKDVTDKPIFGANVVLLGLDVPFIGVVTDHHGKAMLQAPKYHKIHGFRVSMIGYEQISHQIIKGNVAYEVVLVEKFGQKILVSKIEKPFRKRGKKLQIGRKLFAPLADN